MRLTAAQQQLLLALQAGNSLKVARTLDGEKVYRLYTPDGTRDEHVPAALVQRLEQAGLIESNMKFPAATFLLTDKGATAAARLSGQTTAPVGPRNYSQ